MLKMKNSYSWTVAVLIMVTFLTIRLSYPPRHILTFDVFGYYLYLPALFIYDDPGLKNVEWVKEVNEKYEASPSLYQLAKVSDTNWAIRFNSGIAIMYAPFFLGGHVAAHLTGHETDGFSKPYQWAIILSGLFYTLAGVWFLRKALISLFSDRVVAITLALVFIGSNVFFFCTWGNDAPHIYIFTLYALILWLTSRWMKSPRAWHAIALGLVTGVTLITRPSEIFILLVPVFWGVWNIDTLKDKVMLVWRRKRDVMLIILFTALAVLPQLLYWKFATGQWIYNSYDDPQSGFNFTEPRFAYVLTGFRKGFYIYSPMMIFATIGFYHLYKYKRELFLSVLLFFLANVYLIASYSSLVSYGWRAFVQAHAVLSIPLACFVTWNLRQKQVVKWILFAVLMLFLLLNLFKSWQTLRGIIDGSRMTRAYYLDTFFSIDPKNVNKDLLLVERSEESIETLKNEEKFDHRVVQAWGFEQPAAGIESLRDTSFSHQGKYSLRLDSANIFSPAIEIPFHELTGHYYAWLRASAWIYEPDSSLTDESLLIIHFNYEGRPYKYRAASFQNRGLEIIPGRWNRISIDYMTPEVRTKDDPVKIYIWYRGKGEIYVDDLTLEVFESSNTRHRD